MANDGRKQGVIALFDVDGTLTVPRKEIDAEMKAFMTELRKHVTVGIVGEPPHHVVLNGNPPEARAIRGSMQPPLTGAIRVMPSAPFPEYIARRPPGLAAPSR